jgi:hypothetical protein
MKQNQIGLNILWSEIIKNDQINFLIYQLCL